MANDNKNQQYLGSLQATSSWTGEASSLETFVGSVGNCSTGCLVDFMMLVPASKNNRNSLNHKVVDTVTLPVKPWLTL